MVGLRLLLSGTCSQYFLFRLTEQKTNTEGFISPQTAFQTWIPSVYSQITVELKPFLYVTADHFNLFSSTSVQNQ